MEETLGQIEELFEEFVENAEKAISGNKTAGARSRKASSKLDKLLKEWRKESLRK